MKSVKNINWHVIYFMVLLSFFSLFNNNHYLLYGFGDDNAYLVYAQKIIDPSFIPRDFFMNYFNGLFNVRFYFNYLFAFFAYFIGLQNTQILLYFFNAFFLCLGVYLLSLKWWKNKNGAFLAVLLVLITKPIQLIAQITPLGIFPHSIAVTFVIWAIMFFYEERYFVSGLLCGLAAFFHVSIGAGSFLFLIFLNKNIITSAKFVFAFVFFSAPNLVLLFLNFLKDKSLMSSQQFLYYMRDWQQSTLFSPLNWNASILLSNVVFLLMFFVSFSCKPNKKAETIMRQISFFILFLFVANIFFTEVIPIDFIMKLNFLRLILFVYFFILLYVSNWFSFFLETNKKILSFLLVSFSLAGFYVLNYATDYFWFYLFLIAGFFLLSLKNPINKELFYFFDKNRKIILISLLVSFIFFVGYIIISTGKYYGVIRIVSSVGFIFSLCFFFASKKKQILFCSVFILFLCVSAILTISAMNTFHKSRFDLYNFITENTSSSDLFFIPQTFEDFRLRTNRSPVVDFISTGGFENVLVLEWMTRIRDITNGGKLSANGEGNTNQVNRLYHALNESYLLSLSKKYNAKYAVFKKEKKLNFPVYYQNKDWIVYELKNENE